jgi:hypothetical protein
MTTQMNYGVVSVILYTLSIPVLEPSHDPACNNLIRLLNYTFVQD